MATDLSDGYIYLIESDAGDNQNWVPTPGNIDLDSFTEGTEYCKLEVPKGWAKRGFTGIQIDTASSGTGFMTRTSRRYYMVTIESNETIGSDAHNIDKFLMIDRHTASSGTTFTQYYLVICRDESGSDFEEFINSAGSAVDYCKGAVTNYEIQWSDAQCLRARVKLTFLSNW